MALLSYNGWEASRDPKAIGINPDWEPIPGHRFPGGIKSGDVETVMTWVVRQLHERVEPIDRDAIKDEWGWFYKPSANSPDLISCHSSGTAFDYNATRHPNGHRGTFTPPQVIEIHKIVTEAGVVRWLGDASGTADEMHFEIHATPREVAAAADRIRHAGMQPAPTPAPSALTKGDDMFTYEYDADGAAPNVLVLVAGGKQVRITNNAVMDRRRKSVDSHLGPVDKTEFDAFAKAYGPVAGL